MGPMAVPGWWMPSVHPCVGAGVAHSRGSLGGSGTPKQEVPVGLGSVLAGGEQQLGWPHPRGESTQRC